MNRKVEPFVYFIKPIGKRGPIKIGCSEAPLHRLSSLAAWSPYPLEIIATVPGNFKVERNVHECFADLHSHREWFRAGQRLIDAIAALKNGTPLEQAIDLSQRKGPISALRYVRTPAFRRYMGLRTKLWQAVKRADTGDGWYSYPDDIEAIFRRACSNDYAFAEGEVARIEQVISAPADHCRYYSRQRAA